MSRDKKKVIFVADDFGQAPGINKAIMESFEQGVVRSTSIVINGKYAEEAVSLAREHPELETGIHLALVSERPVLPLHQIPSLVNIQTNRFYDNRYTLFLKIVFGRISLTEIESELEHQIIRFKSSGLSCSFVNSHDHIHCFPAIFPIVLKLCQKYKITYIRVPNERIFLAFDMIKSREFWKGFLGHRNVSRIVLRLVCLLFNRKYSFAEVRRPDYFQGILYNCVNSNESLGNIIRSLRAGVTEVICHPAYEDEEYRKLPTYRYMRNYKREEETQALCSSAIRNLLKAYDIELATFRSIGTE